MKCKALRLLIFLIPISISAMSEDIHVTFNKVKQDLTKHSLEKGEISFTTNENLQTILCKILEHNPMTTNTEKININATQVDQNILSLLFLC